jgi:anaerobic selenocysteine-containing dehydrogenase
MEIKPSVCRNCPSMCPILVTVDEGVILKAEGDRDAPLYQGYICPKGRAIPQQYGRPNRLLRSLKRLPDGTRVPISSDALVEEIAVRLSGLLKEHDPQAVAIFMGMSALEQPAVSGMLFAFAGAIETPLIFTNATIDQPGLSIAQALHGSWDGGRIHPDHWETLLLVGGNPVISKQHLIQNPSHQLKSLTRAGAQLIVIDPRRSETARRAAVHLQLIPGEDPTVLAGLINLIFELDGVDHDFVRDNVEGVQALREATHRFTPDYVAARAGIEADTLWAAARILVKAKTGDTALGVGPSMATRGTLSSYLALCIQTLRGFWAREGDPVSRPRVLMPPADAKAQASAPRPAWGFGLKTSVRGLQQTAAGMPAGALPELMLAKGEDRVRALFSHGGPMYSWPQQSRTIEALNALDLFVTHDIELSATSAMADYVIATKLPLEVPAFSQVNEISGLVHPGYNWTEPYAIYQPAILEPPAGSDLLESWQLYYRVAQKLGLTLEMVDFAGANPPIPLDMTEEPTTDDLYEIICTGSVIPLSRVKEHPHGGLFDEARSTVLPRDPSYDARLQLADPAMLAELTGVREENILERRKTNADYPFLLIPRRMQNSTNSMPRVDGIIRTGYNPLFMHPDDMARSEVKSAMMVELKTRHGTAVGFVEADPDLRPGVVAMTHGFGARHGVPYEPRLHGTNVNQLLSWEDDNDPYNGMPRMGAVPISILPFKSDTPDPAKQ